MKYLSEFPDCFIDGLGDVIEVAVGDAGHADAAVLQQVDVLLLHEELARIWRESGEGEHADLLRDVLPASRGSQLLDAFLKPFPHGDYSLGHRLDAAVPLRSQCRVVQHGVDDAGAVRRLRDGVNQSKI